MIFIVSKCQLLRFERDAARNPGPPDRCSTRRALRIAHDDAEQFGEGCRLLATDD